MLQAGEWAQPMTDGAGAEKQMKTLVIHIGDHKTGTTTLQNALAAGRLRIEGADLLYPARLNHNYLMGHITAEQRGDPPPKTRGGQQSLAALAERIQASDAQYAVLSGEVFENVPAPRFREVVERHFRTSAARIRIVAYVRPHAQRILSSYAEQIKIGWFRGSMQEFFAHNRDSGRFHYLPRFRKWQECFGEDFILRPMIRGELRGGSVLQDFAHTAFDGRTAEIAGAAADNQSLGLRELALLHFLQGQYQDKGKWLRHTLGWELARRLGQLPPPPGAAAQKLAMDRGLAEAVAAEYSADAAAMDQDFFGGRPLLQAALAEIQAGAIPAPQPLQAEQYFSAGELRNLTVMAGLVHDMLAVQHPWPAYFHRNRIKDLQRGHQAAGQEEERS